MRIIGSLLVLLMGLSNVQSGEIELLDAFHIAEIYTTQDVQGWSMADYKGELHYVLTVPQDGNVEVVWVHQKHGRVSKIEKVSNDESEIIYHWPGIKVVAHRGGVGLGLPENTIPAIEKAIEVGAQLIEIDIRETKDGHLVLMHDTTVDRTTDGTGRVEELTLDEIRQLDAGSWLDEKFAGTKVPTLVEALQVMKGKIDPDLDFKEGSLEKLVEVVNKVGVADQCTHNGTLERNQFIQQLEPNIFIRPTVFYQQEIPEVIQTLSPPLINMDWQVVSESSIRLIHRHGDKAFVNCLSTADNLLYAKHAALAGADYIQTDYPDKVIELLKEMGLIYDPKMDIGGRVNPLANPKLRYPLR